MATGSHRCERISAFGHWVYTDVVVTTMTVVGNLPSIANDSRSSGSVENSSGAVDPQRHADAGHEEQQADPRIDDQVAQRVEAVVATPIGHQQRSLVDDPDEARRVATRRAVEAVGTGGGDEHERRRLDVGSGATR